MVRQPGYASTLVSANTTKLTRLLASMRKFSSGWENGEDASTTNSSAVERSTASSAISACSESSPPTPGVSMRVRYCSRGAECSTSMRRGGRIPSGSRPSMVPQSRRSPRDSGTGVSCPGTCARAPCDGLWLNSRYEAVATAASTGDRFGTPISALTSELFPRLVSPTTANEGRVISRRRSPSMSAAASGSTLRRKASAASAPFLVSLSAAASRLASLSASLAESVVVIGPSAGRR